VITQWLADRRERTARQEQWRREDSVRWQEDRKQAYADFLAALSAWDDWVKAAGSERGLASIEDRKPDFNRAEKERVSTKAEETFAIVEFMASDEVRQLALENVKYRRGAGWEISFKKGNPDEPVEPRWSTPAWREMAESKTLALRGAMRKELGLDLS
jgi:hypothetical protein